MFEPTRGERLSLLLRRHRWQVQAIAVAAGVRLDALRRLLKDEEPRHDVKGLDPYLRASQKVIVSDGERCWLLRRRLGLTLAKTSGLLGRTQADVTDMERDRRDASELLYFLEDLYYN